MTFASTPKTESGRDCIVCAMFTRQRLIQRHARRQLRGRPPSAAASEEATPASTTPYTSLHPPAWSRSAGVRPATCPSVPTPTATRDSQAVRVRPRRGNRLKPFNDFCLKAKPEPRKPCESPRRIPAGTSPESGRVASKPKPESGRRQLRGHPPSAAVE